MLHGGLSPGGSRTLSRLDDVGSDVWLRARLADLADEDVDSAEGDPVPVLNWAGLGAPACVIDVELAATTLGHPAHSVSLGPSNLSFKNSNPPCVGPTVGANCHGIVTADVLV